MVKIYNDIFRIQMPNITPHVCRHTYCSNMARDGMHIIVCIENIDAEDAAAEMARLEEVESARREQVKIAGKRETTQRVFRGV